MKAILNMTGIQELREKLYYHSLDSFLGLYRYGSLVITSIFYFLGSPEAPFHLKLGVSVCLFLEAFVFLRVYNQDNSSDSLKRLLITGEIFGLAFILTFTGGISSPFIWYAINPIILAATLQPAYFCWLMMLAFLSSLALFMTGFMDIGLLVSDNHFIFIVFVLITLIAQIYNYFITQIEHKNKAMNEQLKHIKSLYRSIEVFNHHNDPQEIINLFASYSKTLTGADKVIILIDIAAETEMLSRNKDLRQTGYFAVRGPRKILKEEQWYPYLKKIFENPWAAKDFESVYLDDELNDAGGNLLTIKIQSKTNIYGILSAYFQKGEEGESNESMEDIKPTLNFLGDLCGVALEKYRLGYLTEKFLLLEEKDRIADEIHDNVTQNIFGIVYGIDNVTRKYSISEDAHSQLKSIQKTAQRSIKELRKIIYSLSTKKNNSEPFVKEVRQYLQELENINDVSVEFDCAENLNSLGYFQRKTLFRIIREATGNAVRHGRCSNIKVALEYKNSKDATYINLSITDDGCGFVYSRVMHEGIGLHNMRELVRNLGGRFDIESSPGRGTSVCCQIPAADKKETGKVRYLQGGLQG